ncbi:MAG: cytidylate kinase family protein [Dehalococcoidia bacterium]
MAIITISRGTFSGGRELAELVASELGYECVSREILVEAAQSYGVSLDKLSGALEETPGILQGMSLERAHYLAYIQATLSKYAQSERLVYHGHAGHLLLYNVPHVLRVKVIASMEYRIDNAMERKTLSREQAIRFINKIDSDRARWTKFLYHVDWNDLSLYDLVINLDRMTVNGASEIICLTAQSPEFQPDAKSRKILSDLVLATEVRARIASRANAHDDGLEVEADDGIITLSGTVRSYDDADKIRELVRQMPDVKEFHSRMGARW